jgi:hypothetical protein
MKLRMTLLMLAVGASAFAQNANSGTNKVVVSPGQPIAAAVAAMAKVAGAEAVVDPALVGTVSAATAKLPLEQGLTNIAAANHAQWRRVYLKEAEIPRTDKGAIDVPKLREIVEAASVAPKVSVGVFDPATGTIAMTNRVAATAPSTVEWLKPRKAIYLLYRPAIIGSALGITGDPVADYMATQKNGMASFLAMTPEQRSEAMKAGIEMALNMDADAMGQMMQQSMQAMQNLSPETKAKLMDMSLKMMGNMPKPGANPQ